MPKACPKCGTENVIQAAACSKCTSTFVPARSRSGIRGWSAKTWVFLAVVAFVVWAFATEPARDRKEAAEQRPRDALAACQAEVATYLRSPGSADFPVEARYTESEAGVFTFASYVDSDNSFGASIRTVWSCRTAEVGGSWDTRATLTE